MMCSSKMIDKSAKSKPAGCFRENLVYKISCDECSLKDVKAHYYGETSRTGFLRGKEHCYGHEHKLEENALTKHDEIHHGGGARNI